jgi:hypothetical protein
MAILFVPESNWTTASFLATLLPLAVLLFILTSYYRSWKRLAHVPGPAAAHISILWLLRRTWNKELVPCLIEAGKTYGPFNLPPFSALHH